MVDDHRLDRPPKASRAERPLVLGMRRRHVDGSHGGAAPAGDRAMVSICATAPERRWRRFETRRCGFERSRSASAHRLGVGPARANIRAGRAVQSHGADPRAVEPHPMTDLRVASAAYIAATRASSSTLATVEEGERRPAAVATSIQSLAAESDVLHQGCVSGARRAASSRSGAVYEGESSRPGEPHARRFLTRYRRWRAASLGLEARDVGRVVLARAPLAVFLLVHRPHALDDGFRLSKVRGTSCSLRQRRRVRGRVEGRQDGLLVYRLRRRPGGGAVMLLCRAQP